MTANDRLGTVLTASIEPKLDLPPIMMGSELPENEEDEEEDVSTAILLGDRNLRVLEIFARNLLLKLKETKMGMRFPIASLSLMIVGHFDLRG